MEVAYKDYRDNISTHYEYEYRCNKCASGCITCTSPAPCLATYNWAFRVSLLTISIMCAGCTIVLSCYLYHHRKVKVFKVASPIFLTITLLGCGCMYMEVSFGFCFVSFFLLLCFMTVFFILSSSVGLCGYICVYFFGTITHINAHNIVSRKKFEFLFDDDDGGVFHANRMPKIYI